MSEPRQPLIALLLGIHGGPYTLRVITCDQPTKELLRTSFQWDAPRLETAAHRLKNRGYAIDGRGRDFGRGPEFVGGWRRLGTLGYVAPVRTIAVADGA